jgi:transcriptional regulator with XRE-family HTH domain
MTSEKRHSAAEPSHQPLSGDAESGFGDLLRQLRQDRGMSQAALASRAGMDRSYVNRLEAGERGAPGLAATDALAEALTLSDAEADRLCVAAGLLPRSLRALGPGDPTILLLARRLTDPTLSATARAALRQTVEMIARHWTNRDITTTPATNPPLEAEIGSR